ncbi:unnamed protein product [Amoebophrya sp. A25]|nr:unnamed protein product [Amoebophrya sp. A25]|eukprot:GSA25T00013351001.1
MPACASLSRSKWDYVDDEEAEREAAFQRGRDYLDLVKELQAKRDGGLNFPAGSGFTAMSGSSAGGRGAGTAIEMPKGLEDVIEGMQRILDAQLDGHLNSLDSPELSVFLELKLHSVVEAMRVGKMTEQGLKSLDQVLCHDQGNAHAHWMKGMALLKFGSDYKMAMKHLTTGAALATQLNLPEKDVWQGQLAAYSEQIRMQFPEAFGARPAPGGAQKPLGSETLTKADPKAPARASQRKTVSFAQKERLLPAESEDDYTSHDYTCSGESDIAEQDELGEPRQGKAGLPEVGCTIEEVDDSEEDVRSLTPLSQTEDIAGDGVTIQLGDEDKGKKDMMHKQNANKAMLRRTREAGVLSVEEDNAYDESLALMEDEDEEVEARKILHRKPGSSLGSSSSTSSKRSSATAEASRSGAVGDNKENSASPAVPKKTLKRGFLINRDKSGPNTGAPGANTKGVVEDAKTTSDSGGTTNDGDLRMHMGLDPFKEAREKALGASYSEADGGANKTVRLNLEDDEVIARPAAEELDKRKSYKTTSETEDKTLSASTETPLASSSETTEPTAGVLSESVLNPSHQSQDKVDPKLPESAAQGIELEDEKDPVTVEGSEKVNPKNSQEERIQQKGASEDREADLILMKDMLREHLEAQQEAFVRCLQEQEERALRLSSQCVRELHEELQEERAKFQKNIEAKVTKMVEDQVQGTSVQNKASEPTEASRESAPQHEDEMNARKPLNTDCGIQAVAVPGHDSSCLMKTSHATNTAGAGIGDEVDSLALLQQEKMIARILEATMNGNYVKQQVTQVLVAFVLGVVCALLCMQEAYTRMQCRMQCA